MAPFEGFPDKSEFTPVPNLLFGQVLEEIDDPLALKCFLRVLWLHCTEERLSRYSDAGGPAVGQDAGQGGIGIWKCNINRDCLGSCARQDGRAWAAAASKCGVG